MRPLNYKSCVGFFFVQAFSRGILLSVIPLQALELMGDAQRVSVLYFAVSLGGIATALATPAVIRQIGIYRTFLVATGAMAALGAMLFAFMRIRGQRLLDALLKLAALTMTGH